MDRLVAAATRQDARAAPRAPCGTFYHTLRAVEGSGQGLYLKVCNFLVHSREIKEMKILTVTS